jgi:hypothetical protein
LARQKLHQKKYSIYKLPGILRRVELSVVLSVCGCGNTAATYPSSPKMMYKREIYEKRSESSYSIHTTKKCALY